MTAGPPILASNAGWCSRCLAPIRPGDVVRCVDNTWAHAWHFEDEGDCAPLQS